MYRPSRNLFLALVAIVLPAVFLGAPQAAAQVTTVDCQIVIAPDCGREVKASAQDMSSILTEMTGKDSPVVTDEVPNADREIVVGHNRHLAAMNLDIDWARSNPDGYTIRKAGSSLVITGGPERGTLNGIYVFLEKHLGRRWFAPGCTVIPKRNELTFPDVSNRALEPYDLYQYRHAKLMWDPHTDLKQTVREFCQAFYGPAGDELEQYYHTLNDESSYAEDPLAPSPMKALPGFHCRSSSPPLNLKSLWHLDALFERADAKVRDDAIRLKRIRQTRLFLQYQILCYSPRNEPMFARAVRDFPGAAKEAGLSQLSNVHLGGGTTQDLVTFVKARSSPDEGAKKEGKGQPKREVLLERVEKIYTDGRWNGRPAIVFWKGHYYIFFHAGVEHSSADGEIRVLKSSGKQPSGWTASDVVDGPHNDAEAHVLATDKRLFVYVVVDDHTRDEPLASQVTYTDDGIHWSKPKDVYRPEFSFWKPVTHEGVHYVASDVMHGDRRVELLQSRDGLQWEKVSTIIKGRYTETSLAFLPDDRLLAVIRQGRIAVSRPPYAEWTYHDGTSLGGPALGLAEDVVLVSGRVGTERYPDDQPGDSRTGLFLLDPETMRLRWQMNMLTQWGADLSYPHFFPLGDNRLLMAWYDGEPYEKGVPKQADIFLATLRVR